MVAFSEDLQALLPVQRLYEQASAKDMHIADHTSRAFARNMHILLSQWCCISIALYLKVLGDHLQCDLEDCFKDLGHLVHHALLELVDDGSKQTQHLSVPAAQHWKGA